MDYPYSIGVSSAVAGTPSATSNISSFTLLTDDIVLVQQVAAGSATLTAPSGEGWTEAAHAGNGSFSMCSSWWWKRWGAGGQTDNTSFAFTASTGSTSVVSSIWRNCKNTGNPYEDIQTAVDNSGTNAFTSPSATSTSELRIVVRFWARSTTATFIRQDGAEGYNYSTGTYRVVCEYRAVTTGSVPSIVIGNNDSYACASLVLVSAAHSNTYIRGFTSTFSSGTIVLSEPSNLQSTDWLIAAVTVDGGGLSAPLGWTTVQVGTNTADGQMTGVFIKDTIGGTGGTYTFNGGGDNAGIMIAVAGAAATTPVNISDKNVVNTSQTTITAPSVTTTVNNCLLLWFAGTDNSGQPVLIVPPTNYGSPIQSYTSWCGLGIGSKILGTATTEAAASGTAYVLADATTSAPYTGIHVAIAPGVTTPIIMVGWIFV